MKKIFVLLILVLPLITSAQINENFESGNINNWTESTPGNWSASSTDPINGAFSLQQTQSVTEAGNDRISTSFGSFDITTQTTVWRFQIRYNYNPSGGNKWNIFLFADADASQMISGGAVNGYFFGLNFGSDSDDDLKLRKITNGSSLTVINTLYDWQINIGQNTVAGFEIKRTAAGEWSIFIDENGGFDNLIQIGTTGTETTFTNASYFGILYEYTSTGERLLWIDDVYAGIEIQDLEPAFITSVNAVANNKIIVDFNENIELSSAENIANYTVNNSIGNPVSAVLNPVSNKQVELTFASIFIDETIYTIAVNGVEDLNGNITVNETETFSYTNIAATQAIPVSETEIDIYFNKSPDAGSAENISNYFINNGIGNPATATVDATNPALVHLTLSTQMTIEEYYTVSIADIQDEYGNISAPADLIFFYFEPQQYSVVINEIMCDVSPIPEVIPAREYIELFNNTQNEINLTDWTLTIGTALPKTFPSTIIQPNGYAIICEASATDEMAPFGTLIPVLNATDLTTTGKRLIIKDASGNIIEDISYAPEWYNNNDKDNGGWSMERIDPENFCGTTQNWSATIDYTGGTPGRINSVYAINPDLSSPELLQINVVSSKQLQLFFSENVSSETAQILSNYIINSSINPTQAFLSFDDNSIINIVFENNFEIGENTISISNISDNCSNTMLEYQGNFYYSLIKASEIELMSQNQLRIHFTERVDASTAETEINYTVNSTIGNPSIALVSPADSTNVNLQFTENFTPGQYYTITIENIEDVNSNIMLSQTIDFAYYQAKANDIVFNEIMCDVNPAPVGLPAVQYIELFNTSDYDIDLTNWIFRAESQSDKTLPYVKIKSKQYIILCKTGSANLFSQYGTAVEILSSSDLTVSGKNIKLLNPTGEIIANITYSSSWYNDTNKDDGGWSIEKIDSYNFCGEESNWKASTDQSGGTPGKVNSVNAANPDNTKPELLNMEIVSSNSVILYFNKKISFETGNNNNNYEANNSIGFPTSATVNFENETIVTLVFENNFIDKQVNILYIKNIEDNCGNIIENTSIEFTYHLIFAEELWVKDEKRLKIQFSEPVDIESGTNTLNYLADNGLGNPETIIAETSNQAVLHIQFANTFIDGKEYKLSLSGIKDKNGNEMLPAEMYFTYYLPKENDIIINEILFNPFTGGSDFVEIYNRSSYTMDLSNFQLANRDDAGALKTIISLSKNNLNIAPGEFFVFTADRKSVIENYLSQNEDGIIQTSSFPSYSDDEGNAVLLYNNTSIIDEFSYNEDMHLSLLDSQDGVSLERVNYDIATDNPANWHSASETVGFATPAYKNSQFSENIGGTESEINILPEMFSPDNDGFDDYCNINYKFESNGNIANVYVFDANGRIIKRLCNNTLLQTEGTIVWDGLKDDNTKARIGIYLIYFETFDTNGTVKKYKKTTVLANKY